MICVICMLLLLTSCLWSLLYPLKTENQRFSDVFRECSKTAMIRNGLEADWVSIHYSNTTSANLLGRDPAFPFPLAGFRFRNIYIYKNESIFLDLVMQLNLQLWSTYWTSLKCLLCMGFPKWLSWELRLYNWIHYVKCVPIRSYFWFVFACLRTEYGEILRISPYPFRIHWTEMG